MGEKIRDIGSFNERLGNLKIELNKESSKGGLRSIHIQNEKVRFSVDEISFIQMTMAMYKAKAEFLKNKEMLEEE